MASDKKFAQLNTFIETKYIPLDDKVKAGVFVALIVLPIVLFYFLSYSNHVKKVESLNNEKSTLQTDLDKAKKAANELGKVQDEIKDTEAKFKNTAIVLPKEKEIPGLLISISDLGKRAALDFNQFSPGGEIPKDFYAEIPVNISINGPYHNIGYFLDKISKLERIVTVNNITMSSPKKEGNEMMLGASMRLVTYRFTGKQQAPPPQKR